MCSAARATCSSSSTTCLTSRRSRRARWSCTRKPFPCITPSRKLSASSRALPKKKHIAVGIEIGAALAAVTLDEHKFKQVLYNLLSNAVKFSDDGGQVSIKARCLDTYQFE